VTDPRPSPLKAAPDHPRDPARVELRIPGVYYEIMWDLDQAYRELVDQGYDGFNEISVSPGVWEVIRLALEDFFKMRIPGEIRLLGPYGERGLVISDPTLKDNEVLLRKRQPLRPRPLAKGAVVHLKDPIREMAVIEDHGDGSILVMRRGISGWVNREDLEE